MIVSIATVKAQTSFGQSDTKMVDFGVFKFLHHPHFAIGHGTVIGVLLRIVVAVLIDLCAIVNIEALGADAGGSDELDLFGFLIVKGGRPGESVEMEFVE